MPCCSGSLSVDMEADALPVGQDVQVVDPEVRAHVYSLVTAVCDPCYIPPITNQADCI